MKGKTERNSMAVWKLTYYKMTACGVCDAGHQEFDISLGQHSSIRSGKSMSSGYDGFTFRHLGCWYWFCDLDGLWLIWRLIQVSGWLELEGRVTQRMESNKLTDGCPRGCHRI